MSEVQDAFTRAGRFCNLPDDPNVTDWEVGYIDGQLLSHGASRALIRAVADQDSEKIFSELAAIRPEAKQARLTEVTLRVLGNLGQKLQP
jgi:hypothetical protein